MLGKVHGLPKRFKLPDDCFYLIIVTGTTKGRLVDILGLLLPARFEQFARFCQQSRDRVSTKFDAIVVEHSRNQPVSDGLVHLRQPLKGQSPRARIPVGVEDEFLQFFSWEFRCLLEAAVGDCFKRSPQPIRRERICSVECFQNAY